MANPAKYVWVDDELKDAAQASVPVVNAGLHYGFSVFEGIRCYATEHGAAVFRLEEHVDRLLDSAHIVGFRDLPWNREGLIDAIHKTIAANRFAACYIRPVIYLDGGMNLVVDSGKPRLLIAVWEWRAFFGDEAIMLDPQGFVAECTGENIFVVRKNVIYTVPRGTILEGITREALITLARDSGYEVVEEPISRDQLYIADEVFVCGTAAEVIALREIDCRTIGTGKAGPITRALQQAFDEVTSGGHARSAEWLSYVPAFDAAVARV